MRLRSILTPKSIPYGLNLTATLLLWFGLLCPALADRSITMAWPPNPEPTVQGYLIYYGTASGQYTNALDVGNVTSNTVPGLVDGTTYYFVVTAYDASGLESVPSTEVSFMVPGILPPKYTPVAGTMAATINSPTGAVIKGAVNPNGAETIAWFEYGLDNRYGWSAGLTNLGSGTGTLLLNSALSGLLPGQTYHYRVVASNSVGLTNGADLTFTLPGALPSVATQPATSIKSSAATLNASVNPNGAATLVWWQYGTNSSYSASSAAVNVPPGNDPVSVNNALTGLQPGVTYHFRVAANNSAGTAYGSDLTFVTPQIQTVTTNVTLAWPANAEPDIEGYIVYYGCVSGAYTNSIDVGNVTNYTFSGLASGVTYYFAVTAYNCLGLESAPSGEISVRTAPVGPVAARPVLATYTATPDNSSSAIFSGQVNPNGAATTAWFEYGLDTTYGRTIGKTVLGSGTNFVSLNFFVGGFLPGRTYHYRLVATNSIGITPGVDLTFTTPAALPYAVTEEASDVSSDIANLNASVNPGGGDTWVCFEYGQDTTYGLTTASSFVPAGNSDVIVKLQAIALIPGAVYHYRVLATNSVGKATGLDATFTTLAQAPTVSTEPPDAIGLNQANLNGGVDPNGASTAIWFEYGLDTSYGSITGQATVGPADGALSYTCPLTTLNTGVTYHYRMVASNILGMTFGADVSFTTLSSDAAVSTLPATAVVSTSATLQGAANPNGTPAWAWFDYGLTTNYGSSTAAQDIGAGSEFVTINSVLSNLQPGTTWHYRLVATNSAGLKYGDDMTFATPPTDLSATTMAARVVKSQSAALYASVIPAGYPATVYFEYGTTANFTNTSTSILLSAGNNAVSVNKRISNLYSGTTYFYRVVATNKYDKVYGEVLSFTTR